MTSREEFMRQMGLSMKDLETPPAESTTTRTRRPVVDDDVRPAKPATATPAQSRADFLRSLGMDEPSSPSSEPKVASRVAPKASPAAAPPGAPVAPAGSQSRSEFLRSLGIDNFESTADTAPAKPQRNATGSQEYPRNDVPSARSARRAPRHEEEEEDSYSYSPTKYTPAPTDLTLGPKAGIQKAPATPAVDAELQGLSDSAGAEEVKAIGNKYFQAGDYRKAVRLYTRAIELDSTNSALYSNRSAAYLLGAKQMGIDTRTMALRDADKAIKLKPTWFKGFSRRGDALLKLERYEEAAEAYEAALQLDPGNSGIVHSLNEVRPYLNKKKNTESASWSAPGNAILGASVASQSAVKTSSKSAYELLDEFQVERERTTPYLGRGGSDYKSEQLERHRARRTGDTLDSSSGTFEAPSATRERPSVSKASLPSEFSSDAARDYQNALLESYRKKKAAGGR